MKVNDDVINYANKLIDKTVYNPGDYKVYVSPDKDAVSIVSENIFLRKKTGNLDQLTDAIDKGLVDSIEIKPYRLFSAGIRITVK